MINIKNDIIPLYVTEDVNGNIEDGFHTSYPVIFDCDRIIALFKNNIIRLLKNETDHFFITSASFDNNLFDQIEKALKKVF